MLKEGTIRAIKQSGLADRIVSDLSARLDECVRVLAAGSGEIILRAQGEYRVLNQIISEIKE